MYSKQLFMYLFSMLLQGMVESYSQNTGNKVTSSSNSGVCFYGDTANRVLNLMAADGNKKTDFKPKDCKDLHRKHEHSGIYKIYPDENEPQSVYCDMETDGGGWTVIVRRVDGSENFNRNWHTYERGFGNLKREFWIGNSVLHSLTTNGNCEVRVDLTNFKGEKRFAKYSSFTVGNSASKYKLSVGGYSGNAGDSLSKHNGLAFSTPDSDNDTYPKGNCAATSGWWYYACDNVSLTKYYNKKSSPIEWEQWKGSGFSIKYAVMMTRPK
ncbi:ficolin-1-like [Mytilus californianus]|uniref:ficolin-1-like n=1 Tax=Mytilus californianus TaxID=6549 RepID=UPI0022474A31|nr:ficolin-1-like [Mytilus californianus]